MHPIKTMNEKIKVIQKENENRKAVIRTQRWRLRIKLQNDNIDKRPTVPEDNTDKQPTVPEDNTDKQPTVPEDNTDKQPTVPEESLTIVGPNMTEKRKNNKVYYNSNWPVSQANHEV